MSTITRLTATEVASAVAELPPMPASISEVIAACDDQDMTVGQLSQVILRDQSLTTRLKQANARIFEEDRAVLEAQQQAIEARPGQALNNLNIDAGSLWARRLIDGMIERESAMMQTAPAAAR